MNKNIIALGFVSFFTDMASSMISTILPIYIVYHLHEGVDKLGFIVAIATFISYGFRILFGYLSDKYQIVKPFVITGYTISALTKPLLAYTSSWQSIAALRGLERMGKALRSASKDTLISSYAKKNQSGKTFGFHKTMDIAGEMSGAIIAFFALWYLGKGDEVFQNIFLFTFIPGVLSIIIVVFFVQDIPYTKREKKVLNISNDTKVFPLLLLYFGFLFFMFDTSFYLLKAKESGISTEFIPLLVILLTLTQTLFSYIFGINIDKYGAKKVLQLSFFFGILSLASLYFSQIMAAFIFLGMFLVASLNSIRSYISQFAKKKGRFTVYFMEARH